METLLELKNVTAGYEDNIILKKVNLSVYENDFLGIIGPNGSGKTTLAKVIMGLLKPFKGEVEYKLNGRGNNNGHVPLGYLPQLNRIDHKFPITVMDVVLSGLASRKSVLSKFSASDREKAKEQLAQMDISNFKNRQLSELSGGQIQRVFLARALISSPGILVLDEPDTFIDRDFKHDLLDILNRINEKVAIILITHNIGVIYSNVKNIACICNNSIHYHSSKEITQEQLDELYKCPVDIITHGDVPHRVLKKHPDHHEHGKT